MNVADFVDPSINSFSRGVSSLLGAVTIAGAANFLQSRRSDAQTAAVLEGVLAEHDLKATAPEQ